MGVYFKGLLIGRFQPFHKGHLYLIKHVTKKVKKLVIGIGSANVYDEANPLTYEERKKMLEKVVREEKLSDFVEKIVQLNDYYDDKLWFKNTLHKTGQIDVVIGNNEWVNTIFEKRKYHSWRVGFYKKYLYEGTKIRRLIHDNKPWIDRVPTYLIDMIKRFMLHVPRFRFNHIALGGTFDHFHDGHKELINTALKYGRELSIGITTSELYKDKKNRDTVESFQQRKNAVYDYIKKRNGSHRVKLFKLTDIYGSTRKDGTIEAIVVSKLTYSNAIIINVEREKNNLPELIIICINDVKATDGKLISSERIRNGEIDRKGYCYVQSFQKTLILPEYLRSSLRKPHGKVIKGKENKLEKAAYKVIQFVKSIKPSMVIAVGDIISNSLEKVKFIPDVKIIDYRSRRQEIKRPKQIGKTFINKQGTITREAATAIQKAINLSRLSGGQALKVQRKVTIDGEEDLLALPSILLAPSGSLVLYGQIDLGVVVVEVTEKKKKQIKKIVDKFDN